LTEKARATSFRAERDGGVRRVTLRLARNR
jgi:hypothetical protein